MSKSGLRWADSSSDESESEDEFGTTTQHAGLNDGSIGVNFTEKVIVSDMNIIKPRAAGFSSDEESSMQSESSSDDDVDDEEEKKREAMKKEVETKKKVTKKPLSKKEKQALKAKELDDLDDLLNEFGVDTKDEIVTPNEVVAESEPNVATTTSTSKKKKKRNKKKNTTAASVEPTSENVKTVDVAAVVKAKAKPKEKSAAEKAAATAAKEAKEKAKNANKKKKKKKDKYAHGAPSR